MERTITITVEVDNNEHAKGLVAALDTFLSRPEMTPHSVFMSPLPKFFEPPGDRSCSDRSSTLRWCTPN